MIEKRFFVCMISYLIIAVFCFGPATVQSEKSINDRCQSAFDGNKQAIVDCESKALEVLEGMIKAMFWPLWLSYTVADEVSKRGEP